MRCKKFLFGGISLFLSLVFVQLIMAGTTGKIAGRVIDKATGKPLMGANVFVVSTSMGAAADANGDYTILHVPPGVYSVRASVIGYTTVTVTQVQVRIDQTARVNFELAQEVVAGQTVTIVAERKPVKKDVSTSVASLSGNEVRELPLNTVKDVVGLQAGVEAGMVIRGGNADEALFQVDGITLRDPRTNQPMTGIALSAVKEVSVERGGFNAEYGQVRSGIVNVVTREGSKNRYSGTITLKYGPPAAKHFGISPFDPNSMLLRPYLDDAVCWTGTKSGGWDYYTQRQYKEFKGWNAVSKELLTNNDPTDDLSPAAAQRLFMWQHRKHEVTNQPDYDIDAGFGGPVPFVSKKLGNLRFFTSYRRERDMLLIPLTRDDYVDYNWSLQLTSDISRSIKLKGYALIGKSYNVAQNEAGLNYSTQYIRTPDQIVNQICNQAFARATDSRVFSNSYFSLADVSNRTISVKLTHMLNPSTFYETRIEYISRKYHTEPIALRDTTREHEIVPGYYADESPFGFSPYAEPGIDGMMTGGHTSTARDYSKISSTTFKFDLTSQVDFHNLVKTGIEFVYNNLNLNYGNVKLMFPEGNVYVRMHKFPLRGAMYVQDKLETKGFVLNAGLRLDYSNANTEWVSLDPFNSFFSSNYDSTQSYNSKKAKSYFSLSPRLGISHPITENSKLFFNYGHFKELPTYEQMFRISRGASGALRNIGDPDLTLAKTISYELGFDHSLYDTYLIQLAAFYHDITDQQAVTNYISADGTINYFKANNNSYEDVRGFEATFKKTTGRWWGGFINYTYQVSTLGHFGRAEIYQDPSEQSAYDRNTKNLYQERPIPQPYARMNLFFYTPSDFGPEFLGSHFLSDWRLNVIGDWRAGWWTTWNPNQDLAISQNLQVKDWYNFRLRLTKTFSFKKMSVSFFIDMDNVLNTKRLSLNSFYDVNDYLDYFNSLHLPKSTAYNNIVGNDRAGEYRKDGVPFQPIEQIGNVTTLTNPNPKVIYYENTTGKYMNYVNGDWLEVNSSRMKKILNDRAYIDMPNMTSFNFLNPRRIFLGLRVRF